jgi:hypothetical protein
VTQRALKEERLFSRISVLLMVTHHQWGQRDLYNQFSLSPEQCFASGSWSLGTVFTGVRGDAFGYWFVFDAV